MPRVTPLIAGNWKMNGLRAALGEVEALTSALAGAPVSCEVVICPPATLISGLVEHCRGSSIAVGAQDCSPESSGAFTGDISAAMLVDAGARYVILGHSERRALHGETDGLIRRKAEAAIKAGLMPIICVGETETERAAGVALTVVERQLQGSVPHSGSSGDMVIAYEPVWAIGTGLTPSLEDIGEMHQFLRQHATARFGERGASLKLLYGGSMKPGNAAEILSVPNVNGGLVGGASLKASDFLPIIRAGAGAA